MHDCLTVEGYDSKMGFAWVGDKCSPKMTVTGPNKTTAELDNDEGYKCNNIMDTIVKVVKGMKLRRTRKIMMEPKEV